MSLNRHQLILLDVDDERCELEMRFATIQSLIRRLEMVWTEVDSLDTKEEQREALFFPGDVFTAIHCRALKEIFGDTYFRVAAFIAASNPIDALPLLLSRARAAAQRLRELRAQREEEWHAAMEGASLERRPNSP